jgi:shikimate kinase
VPQIIEQDGEEHFRQLETQVVRDVMVNNSPSVVALGGGAWTLERNRQLINRHQAITVWLDATFELCWKRIVRGGGSRPLARDEEQARALFDQRRPLYALAEIHVEVSANKSAESVAAEITKFVSPES